MYYFLRVIAWFLCKILFDVKAEGLENLPKKKNVIIAANHSSYLDPVAITAVLPIRIRWLIRKDVYELRRFKRFFSLMGMIPQNGAVTESLATLLRGNTIGIFPEGTRSPDGKLKAGGKGVAILALMTGAPVIVCAVRGSFEAYPRDALFPKRYPVKVVIGRPLIFKKINTPDEEMVNFALNEIMSAIETLMAK